MQVNRHKLNSVYLHKVCSPHVVDTGQETFDVIMKKNRMFRAFKLHNKTFFPVKLRMNLV